METNAEIVEKNEGQNPIVARRAFMERIAGLIQKLVETPESRTPSARQRLLLLITALVSALWGARSCFQLIGSIHRNVKYDLDCIWLMTGVEPTRDFAGTLRWWVGPWCCDFVPYYRPLTSVFFWLEYKVFGPFGLQGFTVVHLLSHLVMVAVSALFFAELLGWKRTTVAMALWCLHASSFFGLGDTSRTFPVWKDSCDIWCSICYISSLWLFLRYLRKGRPVHLGLSLFAFVVGITFKEMVYTLPAMLLLILWYENQVREKWRLVLPYVGVTIVGVTYRFWALNGPGFKNGTNGAWWHRTIVDLGGPPARFFINNNSFPIAVALLLAALVLWRNPARKQTAKWLAGAALLLWGIASFQSRIAMGDLLYQLINPEFWPEMLYMSFFLLLAVRFLLGRRREQWFGYGWAVITHIPLMAMPVGDHGFYLVALGWSLWLTEAIADGIAVVRGWLPSLRRAAVSRPTEEPAPAVN